MSEKNAFFPWPLLRKQETNMSFLPRKVYAGPDAEIRGKPSRTALKNDQSLSSMFDSVLKLKEFYDESPAVYQHCKVKITFRRLDEISTRMAKAIAKIIEESQATPNSDGDTVLAFIVNESDIDERMIVMIFAVLKLGISYMALSTSSHPNDLNWAMNVVKPVLLVSGDCLSSEVENTLDSFKTTPGLEMVTFERLWSSSRIDNVSLDKVSLSLDMNDPEMWGDVPLAERIVGIFFTAGSVSSPHAVRIGTREILNRLHWQSKIFPTVPSDAFALTSPFTDPRALIQILTPILLYGKPITLLSQLDQINPERLVDRVAEVKLTRLTLTPPCFDALVNYASKNVEAKGKLASITHWFVSGGRLKIETGRKFFAHFSGIYTSGVFLVAMYGMTEVLGEATFEVFFNMEDLEKKTALDGKRLSVGVPITNSTVAIVDRFDKTMPLGGRGEVVLSGGCLSTGGYVGQGSGRMDKSANRSNSSAELRKRHILFRTGDIGSVIVDSNGTKRLYIDGRFDNETIKTGGRKVNLQQWLGEVMFTKLVSDAAVIAYSRGRDSQVVVAAVVLKPEATCVQVLEKIHARKDGFLNNNPLPTVFAVDKVPLISSGRVDKKQIRILFRKILLECNEAEWQNLQFNPEDAATAKFLCKAIALSTGLPLVLVIRRFVKSFEELGGTPLNGVIVVKMCQDNGYPISMKDFISAKTIGDLINVLKMSTILNPEIYTANVLNDFDGKFSFNIMSLDDIQKVILFLKNDCQTHILVNPQDVIKYWKGVVGSVQGLRMCLVAKLGSTIVGVAVNGEAHTKLQTPKPPKDIAYGLELLEHCLGASKYEMWRRTTGQVARCHFLGVASSNNISPMEKVVLIEELLTRSCNLAESSHYSSLVISTANPVIQEVGIHLLKFRPVLEFPVSRFKSGDGTRPFTYADDNHTAAVLVKNLRQDEESFNDSKPVSKAPSTMSAVTESSSRTKSDTLGGSSKLTLQSF